MQVRPYQPDVILSVLQISENFESREIRDRKEIGFLRHFRFSQNSKANSIRVYPW